MVSSQSTIMMTPEAARNAARVRVEVGDLELKIHHFWIRLEWICHIDFQPEEKPARHIRTLPVNVHLPHLGTWSSVNTCLFEQQPTSFLQGQTKLTSEPHSKISGHWSKPTIPQLFGGYVNIHRSQLSWGWPAWSPPRCHDLPKHSKALSGCFHLALELATEVLDSCLRAGRAAARWPWQSSSSASSCGSAEKPQVFSRRCATGVGGSWSSTKVGTVPKVARRAWARCRSKCSKWSKVPGGFMLAFGEWIWDELVMKLHQNPSKPGCFSWKPQESIGKTAKNVAQGNSSEILMAGVLNLRLSWPCRRSWRIRAAAPGNCSRAINLQPVVHPTTRLLARIKRKQGNFQTSLAQVTRKIFLDLTALCLIQTPVHNFSHQLLRDHPLSSCISFEIPFVPRHQKCT